MGPAPTDTRAESAGEPRYYSISQAAALLGVSRVTIWRWIRDDRLPVARLGHRTARIAHADLERALLRVDPDGSRAWAGRDVTGTGARRDSAATASAPRLDWQGIDPAEHFVQFYESDVFLLDAVADFIGAGLKAGDAGLVVATAAHRQGVEERLRAFGPEVAEARASGRYVSVDAEEMLAQFMVDGAPDRDRFIEVVGGVVARAAEGGRGVRIFGEMVALLAIEGRHAAAVRLEELWNELRAAQVFSLFCAYPTDRLDGQALAELLGGVCAEHSA